MRSLKAFVVGSVFALFVANSVSALAVPPKPALDRPVIDTSTTLSVEQIDSLAAQINKSRSEKAYQIGVLMVPSLEGQAIEDYSLEVARSWGIGDKTNNGVLLLIAKNDRLMRIEVGSGLEGDLTDIESGRIIRNTIAPQFKQGNYYEGIANGVESIQAQVEGRAQTTSSAPEAPALAELLFPIIFFATMIISWFGSLLARSRSWWAGGIIGGGIGGVIALLAQWSFLGLLSIPILGLLGLLFDYFVSKNFYYKTASGDTPSWWAGGNWIDTGGFGGGGGSFGGGGFSGGGSSGSW